MTSPVKNQVFTAEILGYSSEGLGIARIGGQVVFVHDAIAGEVCDILVMKVLKKTAFGKVVAGMDVVDQIAAVRTDWNDKPTTPVKMKTVELIEG